MGIVGRDMWSQGQDGTVSPLVGPGVQLLMTVVDPGAWPLVDLCQWISADDFVSTAPEGHPVPTFSQLKAVPATV